MTMELHSTASVTEAPIDKDSALWSYQFTLSLRDPSGTNSQEDIQDVLDSTVLGLALVADQKKSNARSLTIGPEKKSWNDLVSKYAQHVAEDLSREFKISPQIKHSHLASTTVTPGQASVSYNSTTSARPYNLTLKTLSMLAKLNEHASDPEWMAKCLTYEEESGPVPNQNWTKEDSAALTDFIGSPGYMTINRSLSYAVDAFAMVRELEKEYELSD
jgi:hypothetical protein